VAGPGIYIEEQVEEGAGAQLVQAAVQARVLELPGPPGDPLVGGQHPGRGQFPAGQRGVAGILRQALHPGVAGRVVAALAGLARGDLERRAGDRGAQPAGSKGTFRADSPGSILFTRATSAGLLTGIPRRLRQQRCPAHLWPRGETVLTQKSPLVAAS
jgi:hypothetical protein